MTEHVVTRWYRPPELMLCADGNYDASVDIWSVGCIFAELLGRKPLFPGKNFMHQLCLIFEVIGTPAKKELAFVKSEQAMQFMRSLNTIKKVAFKHIFPGANPKAIDLLENMLVFDPAKRISVDDALNHPYFASVASQYVGCRQHFFSLCVLTPNLPPRAPPIRYTDPEPEMPPEFEFDFENAKLSKADLRRLIVDEVKSFRAEVRARSRARKGKSKGATSSSSSSSLASAASSTASATSNNGRSRSGSRSRDPSGAGGGAGASVRSSSRGKVRSSGYGQKSSTSNNNTAATGSSARGRSSWRDSAAQRRADRSRSNPRRAHAAASAGSRARGTTRRQSDSQATGAAAAAASAGARAGGSGSGSSSGGSHTARGPRPEEDQKKGAIYRTSSGTRMISGKGTAGRTAVAAAAPVAPAPTDDGVDADRGSASSGDDDDEIVTRRTSAPAQRPPAVPAQQPKPHRRNPSAAWTETSEDTPVEARDVSSASASPSGGPATRSPASTEPGVTSPATTPPATAAAAAAASSSPAPAPSAWAHAAVAPGSPPRPSRTAGLSKPMVTPPPTGPTSRRLANGAATPGSLVAQSPLPVSPVNTSEAKQAPPPSPAVAKAAAAATRTARQFAPSSGSRHHVSPPSTSATSATAPGDHIASPAWSPPPVRNARGGYYGSRHQQPRLPPSQRSPQRVARSSGAGATASHDNLRDRVAQASAAASAVLAQPPGRSYMSGVTVPRPFSFATSSRSRSSRSIASTGSADDDVAARAARDRARQRARARPRGSDRDAVGQTVYDAHVSAAAAAGSSGGASGSRGGGGGGGYAEETTGTRDVRMLLRAAGGSHRDVGGSAGAGSAAGSSRGPTVVKPFRFATEDRNRSRSRGHGSTRYGASSGTNGGEGMPATHATAHGVMGRAVSYRRTTSTSSMTSGASGASADHHGGAGGGGGDDDDAGVGGSARPRRKVTVPRSPNFSKMSWERRTGARGGGGSSRSGRHRHPRAHSAARTRKTQVY